MTPVQLIYKPAKVSVSYFWKWLIF